MTILNACYASVNRGLLGNVSSSLAIFGGLSFRNLFGVSHDGQGVYAPETPREISPDQGPTQQSRQEAFCHTTLHTRIWVKKQLSLVSLLRTLLIMAGIELNCADCHRCCNCLAVYSFWFLTGLTHVSVWMWSAMAIRWHPVTILFAAFCDTWRLCQFVCETCDNRRYVVHYCPSTLYTVTNFRFSELCLHSLRVENVA